MMIKYPTRFVLLLATLLCLFLMSQAKAVERSVESLIYDLKNPSDLRRKEAALALGNKRIQAAVPALIEATKDTNYQVRKEVVIALDKIHDMRAVPAFISLLNDNLPEIRRRSIAGLVNLHVTKETGLIPGTKRVVDKLNPFSSADDNLVIEPYTTKDPSIILALKDKLSDTDENVRGDAAKALGIFRGTQAVPDIVASLRREVNADVKVALIKALYKIRDASVGPELLPFIHDPSKKVHDEAILTLGAFRTREAVPELMKLYESGVEERRKVLKVVPASSDEDLQLKLLESLAMIGDKASEDFFVKALRHPNSRFRQAGAEGLARTSTAELATEVSRERLKEKNGSVRLAESFALYRMGRKEYLDDIVNNLSSLTLNDQAASYLEEFNGKEREQLYPYLEARGGKIRERLAEVIGRVGDDSALVPLQKLTKDKNPNVASAALQGIRRIEGRTRNRESDRLKNPEDMKQSSQETKRVDK